MTINMTSYEAITGMAQFARDVKDPWLAARIATTAEVLVRAAAIEPSVVITADFIHGFITAATLGTDESRLMAAGLALRFVGGTL